MAYGSRIKQHIGKCIDCTDGRDKPLTAGRCSYHYKAHRAKELKARDKSRGQKLVSVKSKIELSDEELELWFSEKIEILATRPYCSECEEPIPPDFFRHAVAHIFPKAQFPSVRTAKLNFLFLGAGCGCHEKTHRVDLFSKMKVWPEACRRFRTFEGDITERHKYLTLFKNHVI